MNISNSNSGFVSEMTTNIASNAPSWDYGNITYKIDNLGLNMQFQYSSRLGLQLTERDYHKYHAFFFIT